MYKLLIALVFFSTQLAAQTEVTQPEIAQHEATNWFSDLAAAQAYAAEHDSTILMVFAGSDWCRPCIQFKQDILKSEPFEAYANDKLAVLYLDFPARKKNQLPAAQVRHNEALAEQYNKTGAFPKILLIDVAGNILAEPAFSGQTPEVFIGELTTIPAQ
ncbi:MAG: hypothetical protein DA408_14590 [Bacteroidetes bacterium]|nr:MAG: hypothetical protein C7N36_15355 [Bacteroidota bacterium]PTM11019.1 MAG: hypothetical protein DA408_14590 [Bacteroidota bacterium]